jgi:glycosyltransferase involved in cell wall biosynthesis
MPHLLILPPHRVWPAWTTPPDISEPDREAMFRLLAERGHSYRRLDPYDRPWNPFANAHSVLCAIDLFRALRVLLFHRRADVVFCFYESAALLILFWRRIFLFRGKVVVYDVGDAGNWRLRSLILRSVIPRADMLLPLGRNQVAGLLAMGARPDGIIPVHDATDTDFYLETEDKPEGYILSVGDDVSRDYSTLLQATQGLTRQVIIRAGIVAEDRVAFPNVKVVSNRVSALEYRELIAGAVLVVLPLYPSTHPGGITALLEAMSSGKAVIVSSSPGLADHIQDGMNCRVVRPGDPTALREAIDALLADKIARRRLGADARRFVLENCSAEPDAVRFDGVVQRLVGSASE